MWDQAAWDSRFNEGYRQGQRNAEAEAERLREGLDFLYDAWVDTDVHPRCGYGDCPSCDAISEMAAVLLGEKETK